MKHIIFILLVTLVSCQKEEPKPEVCKTCTLITESNQKEASFYCDGLANNYPGGYIEVSRTDFGKHCGAELDLLISTSATTQKYLACQGIEYTVKTRMDCK